MTVKRIVIEPGKGETWQFWGKHDTGEAHYRGYPTVAAAAEAAAVWAAGNE